MSLTKASYSMITGAPANVLDYGADPTGVADSKSAIDLALASGIKEIYFPKGTYKYLGQMTIPSGIKMIGAGAFAYTQINITYAGFGVVINGDFGLIQDILWNFTQSGFDFSTTTSNTTMNTIDRCDIVGPGAGATKTTNSYVGVRFQAPQGSPARVAYFNNIINCNLTSFNKLVDFESGANANFCSNNNLNLYWYAYYVRSLENRITGGFANNVAGTSSSQLTVAYYLTSTATRNVIEAAVGEPGDFSQGYYLEDGATLNYINMPSSNYSYGNANNSNGRNWIPTQEVQSKSYYNLVENNYYTLKITDPLTTAYTRSVISIRYGGSNDALPASAYGEASFLVSLNGSATISVQMLSFNVYATSSAPQFVGVYVDGSFNLYLVFFHRNNGTATTEGALSVQLNYLSSNIVATLPAAKSAGTLANPTTTPVLAASLAYDAPSIANGASHSFTITMTGAKLSNKVSVTASASISGLTMTAYVSAADTITVVLANLTGGAVDLASMTFYVYAQPQTLL
jgi:hypothetical protein